MECAGRFWNLRKQKKWLFIFLATLILLLALSHITGALVNGFSCFENEESPILDHKVYKATPDLRAKLRVLLYITTHVSDAHKTLLRTCWPDLLTKSSLLRDAEVLVLSTGDKKHNRELVSPFVDNPKVSVVNVPNPGYQEGAHLAMTVGIERGFFNMYDWIIRVNPDVLIVNETWILQTLHLPDVDAIFVDCLDKSCTDDCANSTILIHTDFFAIRSVMFKSTSFNMTTFSRIGNAEHVATFEFRSILLSGRHRWLPGAGPMRGQCRVACEVKILLLCMCSPIVMRVANRDRRGKIPRDSTDWSLHIHMPVNIALHRPQHSLVTMSDDSTSAT